MLGFGLTIGVVSAVVGFILMIQGDITGQMCQATGALQELMAKNMGDNSKTLNNSVKTVMDAGFDRLETKILTAAGVSGVSAIINQNGGITLANAMQGAAALKLTKTARAQCQKAAYESGKTITGDEVNTARDGINIMFYGIQYLIMCMILNRLISESANVSSALVNSTGLNSSTQEVSGGIQGVTGRAGQGSNTAKTI